MKALFIVINQNKLFYGLQLLLIFFVVFLLLFFSRTEGFIWLNQCHTIFLRSFFENITLFGDGWFILLTVVLLLFMKQYRFLAFVLLLSYISSGLFSQLLKNIVSAPRPSVYFGIHKVSYVVDTFSSSRIGFSSFPSGHTASFFAFATVLSLYCRKKAVCICLLLASMLVGYSRIYLAHHFLIDVFVGAVIGVLFGSLSVIWVKIILSSPLIRKWKKVTQTSDSEFPNPYFN
ncbi:hypothetical protein FFWV33_01895 [Flavobacterium faecale]|uniref:Phosphatidic acid phosphatase type 2/haloperoxidase domain-containing protein n=1 Tax=Flavobacterium faecale TaxID=1355330 RepID=A0A2S1L9G9_9FLAO|nr:phosphatase PAP2 family protein [Flavobacterium faecale]AWG20364.1 hypothetical protein FFWV33_01895 [Flavobacterium faecale]